MFHQGVGMHDTSLCRYQSVCLQSSSTARNTVVSGPALTKRYKYKSLHIYHVPQNFVRTAANFGLLSGEELALLDVIPYNLEQPETFEGAIGNAGRVRTSAIPPSSGCMCLLCHPLHPDPARHGGSCCQHRGFPGEEGSDMM